MKQIIAAFLGLLILSSFQQKAVVRNIESGVKPPDKKLHSMQDSIDAIIQKYVLKGIPGIQVAIQNPEGWMTSNGGYANVEKKLSMDHAKTSWLFSITKTYSAVLALLLQEKKLLKLDNPITTYLPAEIYSRIPNSDKINVRMLLNHSSGIANFTDAPAFLQLQLERPSIQPSRQEILAMIYDKPLLFDPATDFQYSNSNYLLLEIIFEKVTGLAYGDLLRRELLQPFGLKQTFYKLKENEMAVRSFPENYLDRNGNGQIENVSQWNQWIANAAGAYGGLAATPKDVIRFYQLLMEGKILSDASLSEMKEWVKGKSSEQPDYGLGLEYFQYANGGSPQYGHEGDGIASSTLMLYVPDNKTYLFVNCTVGRKLPTPYLFHIIDLKNELSRYVAGYKGGQSTSHSSQ